jgi:ubiquinone biosynthesis protein
LIRAAAQDLNRLRQIATVVARHGYGHLAESLRRGKAVPEDPKARAEAAGVGEAPVRLRKLLQDLGPTFIKLGQVLSTRADLVPTRFQVELAKLQDDVPPLPFETIQRQLEAAWGRGVGEVAEHVDPKPLATASIAQVHRARLKDGRDVVLKVQRPGLEKTIRADLDLLYLLARLMDQTIEEMALYRPLDIVRAFERAILDELDFTIEARNARAVAANFENEPRLIVPAIDDALSSRTVLVMQYVEGVKITSIAPGTHDVDAVLATLLDVTFRMAFLDGLFHGDPHPGNVLVLPDNRICLLDYGLVGRLTGNMQQTLIQLSLAVATRDADATVRLVYRIGQPVERVQLSQLRDEVSDLMGRYMLASLQDVDAASLVNDLLDLALRYKIRVPPDYALLAKAAVTLEGILRTLKPDLEITSTILPYAHRLMAERYGPEALRKMAVRAAVTVFDSAQHLPLMAHQIVSDLEAGRLSVRVANRELDRLSRSLNDLGTKVFLGLVASGLIMGTFFVLARSPWEWRGMNAWALIGGVTAGWLVISVITWHLLYTRMKKVSLRALLRLMRRR